jgi:hypothetical protein
MTDIDADSIIKEQSELAAKRANWDTFWQQIAYRVLPNSANFTEQTTEGEMRTDRVFTSTPITANDRFAAFLHEGMTPRDQIWQELEPEDDDLKEDHEVSEYLERLNKALFAARYRPLANFTSQRHDCYLSAGAFGNYCLFLDEEIGFGTRYKSIYIGEVFWAENHQGVVDTIYRKFPMQGRNALRKFGQALPQKIREAAEKEPFRCFDFIHAVKPNADIKRDRRDYAGMEFASCYVSCDEKAIISRGGFRTFPFAIGRFMKSPNETFARSPAMTAFGAILTLNEQKKTVLRAGQKAVDPPMLLQEDGVLEAFDLRAGALNFGAVSSSGEMLAHPLNTGAKVELGVDLMGLEEKDINDAFLVSLFQILSDQPQMTATEVLSRMQERAQILSPTTARLESEDLGPMISREIEILSRDSSHRWIIEEMPEALIERGGAYKITYTSPLAKSRRAADALAITRSLEIGTLAAGVDPDAALVMNVPEAFREVCDINGVPAKVMRSKEDVEMLRQQKQRQQSIAAAAQIAPQMAGAARDVAQAEQIRRASGAA